ncbi:hypothetical protein B0T24DRAFT_180817 [Lasiosphaeria ovina]|uniref:PXA domain-containing protein n=1 Tax=Lasiosphaeria ovina TaxID=92902 RepID=A0AAE0TTZ7_9PEZI|nr:hypothetical protein B0T24DRAFT_180817 [Lasiosphaeria ovina]
MGNQIKPHTPNRLLSYGIHQYLLDPANLPPLLRNVRGALFPNNMPGKPTLMAPSSEAELLLLRRRCASALWALVPKGVGRLYFGSSRGGHGAGARGRGAAVGTREGWDPATPAPAAASASGPARPLPPKGSARQHGQQQHGHGSSASSSPDQDVATALPSQRSAPRSGGQPSITSTADQTSAATIPAALRTSTTDASAAAAAVIKGQEAEVAGAQDDEWALQDIEAGILDVFSDAYCNKHLMYSVVELLLVRLLPEITEKGVVNLWAERLA